MLVELRCWKGREIGNGRCEFCWHWRGKVRGWELVTYPAIAERCCGVLWGWGDWCLRGRVDVWDALEEPLGGFGVSVVI